MWLITFQIQIIILNQVMLPLKPEFESGLGYIAHLTIFDNMMKALAFLQFAEEFKLFFLTKVPY